MCSMFLAITRAFDASEHQSLARTLDCLGERGYIRYLDGTGYPWCEVEVTDSGKQFLKDSGYGTGETA
jgi:hypothetical protein